MFRLAIASIALLAAGCASGGKIIHADSSSVAVKSNGSAQQDFALAAGHCAQFGKNAKMAVVDGWITSFDCVQN